MQYHTCLSSSLHRLKLILIPPVLLMLIFLVTCESPFYEAPHYDEAQTLRITGTITDANSGLPIADATVELYYLDTNHSNRGVKSTKTGQEGLYYMEYQGSRWIVDSSSPFLLKRLLYLRAMKEGYSSRDSQIQNTESLQTINFQLPPLN